MNGLGVGDNDRVILIDQGAVLVSCLQPGLSRSSEPPLLDTASAEKPSPGERNQAHLDVEGKTQPGREAEPQNGSFQVTYLCCERHP